MSAKEASTNAVVLHLRDFGDAHRIAVLCTESHGKVSAVARHARASKKRFGALDLFAEVRVRMTPGASLWTLVEAQVVDARVDLRTSLESIERAARLSEVTSVLLPEHEPAPRNLALLRTGLDAAARQDLAAAAAVYPELVRLAGILPDVSACARCGVRQIELVAVDPAGPGLLCAGCSRGMRRLPRATVQALQGEGTLDAAAADALEILVMRWIEEESGRPLRTRPRG